jgi:hypothetical protein
MKKISNFEDSTLLFPLNETLTEQFDPFDNEIEIQNLRNQSHLTNLSGNNFYSTCFYTENIYTDDFSFIFHNDDFTNANSFLKKIPKFQKRLRKEIYEKKVLQKEKYFYIYKKHKVDCKHKVKKIDRNKIKNLIQKDFFNFFGVGQNNFCKKRFLNHFENSGEINLIDEYSEVKMIKIKKSKNRNFRLFDKDVIIKKIMSNFCKFLKIIFEFFLSKLLCVKNFKIKEFDSEKFYAIEHCIEFLKKNNFSDIVQIKDKIPKSDRIKYNFIFSSNLHIIFSELFINSDFFFNYIIEKIKSKYDNEYFISFMNYTKKIIN